MEALSCDQICLEVGYLRSSARPSWLDAKLNEDGMNTEPSIVEKGHTISTVYFDCLF